MFKYFIFILFLSFFNLSNANENSLLTIKQHLDRLQRDMNDLSKEVYSDVDPRLHPIAEWSLNAHLERLMELGKVVVDNHEYSVNK